MSQNTEIRKITGEERENGKEKEKTTGMEYKSQCQNEGFKAGHCAENLDNHHCPKKEPKILSMSFRETLTRRRHGQGIEKRPFIFLFLD